MSGFLGRNVLVTGATGLVGSWLVRRLLKDDARVTALIRDWEPESDLIQSGLVNRCRVVTGRLEDVNDVERALAEHEIDAVFHLGAQTQVTTALRSPLGTFESNIRGTYNLLEACRRLSPQVRTVVIASSDKAYGDADELPYTESMPLKGRHPYDVSKSCTDLITHCYAHTYGVPVAIARCGNIYGGGDLNWARIVPGVIRWAFRGERPILRSDGTFLRDYLYVEDVVEAYLVLGEKLGEPGVVGEAFNFGPERPLTVLEITREILRLLSRTDLEPIIRNEAKAEIRDQYLYSAKARERLGWTPRWSLDDGLTATIAWYRRFLLERS